jgi:competence protein ComEA
MMKIIKSLLFTALLAITSLCYAEPVNINTADAQTIASEIKGIGMTKAEAIVVYRTEHGPFASIDDLTNVKGIGVRLIEMNKEKLSVK